MTNVFNFIRWALTHVNLDTVPSGTVLAGGTATNVGAEPWHYARKRYPVTYQGEVGELLQLPRLGESFLYILRNKLAVQKLILQFRQGHQLL